MTTDELRTLAVKAGATELGNPPQYIFSVEDLARFVVAVSAVDKCRSVVAAVAKDAQIALPPY